MGDHSNGLVGDSYSYLEFLASLKMHVDCTLLQPWSVSMYENQLNLVLYRIHYHQYVHCHKHFKKIIHLPSPPPLLSVSATFFMPSCSTVLF